MTEYERGYENAIKDAARVCREQMLYFLSPQYMGPMPLATSLKRFACQECVSAILDLLEKETKHDD